MREDLDRALEAYPFAFICTVNGACVEIEEADAIVAGHTEKTELFVKARRRTFVDGKPFEVFATTGKRILFAKADVSSVTRWFSSDCNTGATSAAKAARMMFEMGFDEVILCGCPMDTSGYFPGESQKGLAIGHQCRRLGDPKEEGHRTILGYRAKFKKLAEGEFKGRVFSMSGLTRKWLGGPSCLTQKEF